MSDIAENLTLNAAEALKIDVNKLLAASALMEDGFVIPFIARHRKEETGGLDEDKLFQIRRELRNLKAFNLKTDSYLQYLEEQELLNEDLETKLLEAETMQELEDAFMPYHPRRYCLAVEARERGFEELATAILAQDPLADPEELALSAMAGGAQALSVSEALFRAEQIICDTIFLDEDALLNLRALYAEAVAYFTLVETDKRATPPTQYASSSYYKDKWIVKRGNLGKSAIQTLNDKYDKLQDYSEKVFKIPAQRILLIKQALLHGIAQFDLVINEKDAIDILNEIFLKNDSPSGKIVSRCIESACRHLLMPCLRRETLDVVFSKAEKELCHRVGRALRELVLAPPLRTKNNVLAINPNPHSGAKCAIVDCKGKALEVLGIHTSQQDQRCDLGEARADLTELIARFDPKAIVLGTAAGTKEIFAFLKKIPMIEDRKIPILIINTSGIINYSICELALREFPNLDVCSRGAISIGRRLLDPLNEITKLDLASLTMTNLQSLVDQEFLKETLWDAMGGVIGDIGLDVNSAPAHLLKYVPGLNADLASRIVRHRERFGPFRERPDLLTVQGMSELIYRNCASFLLIPDGINPLDDTLIHPDYYYVAEKMAASLHIPLDKLIRNVKNVKKLNPKKFLDNFVGLPTVFGIMNELRKPADVKNRSFKPLSLEDEITDLKDIKVGMRLKGIVNNITSFGAFLNFGLPMNGLLHVNNMSESFIRHPSEICAVGQTVTVWVQSVNPAKHRLELTMIPPDKDEELNELLAFFQAQMTEPVENDDVPIFSSSNGRFSGNPDWLAHSRRTNRIRITQGRKKKAQNDVSAAPSQPTQTDAQLSPDAEPETSPKDPSDHTPE
ncbi:MAG: helix-hairpin-helix domain-containing protein [Deltaproteobacteria bacterium]|jgi:uncharacterized protein|nr:helix-hairpin-helix domain-containing protein [Deltaproteobacteria bacterium]